MSEGSPEHLDVLIVGAGLSGIGAAWHLQERCPGKSYAILEARDDLGGTWDLFRYPGIRSDSDMHTLGYRFKPWTAAKSIADGDLDPRVRAGDGAGRAGSSERIRFHHRVVERRVVERRRALDGRGRAHRHGGDGAADLRLPLDLQRLLPLRRGLHARVRGGRALRRPGRPPAALARGPRLQRQAGGRDRQRRHRGDAGAGDGGEGRARDDAAALADLHRLAAGRGPDRRQRCAAACPSAPPTRWCAGRTSCIQVALLPAQPPPAGADQALDPQGRRALAAAGLRRRQALQAPLQPLGPAHVPGPRRRPLPGDLARAKPRSSPTGSRPSPSAGSSSSPARSWRPT